MIFSSSVALLLAGLTFIVSDIYNFRSRLYAEVSSIAGIVSHDLEVAMIFGDESAAKQTLNSLRADPRFLSAVVYDSDLNIFSAYHSDLQILKNKQSSSVDSDITGSIENNKIVAECYDSRITLDYFEICKTITSNKKLGNLYMRLSLDSFYSQLLYKGVIIFSILGIIFFFTILVIRRVAKIVSRPILSLATLADDVSKHRDYTVRAVREADDEVGVLTDGFNQMLQEVHNAQTKLQQYNTQLESLVAIRTVELSKKAAEATRANQAKSEFLSRMSHELRTPMNAILGFGELLEMKLPEGQDKSNASKIMASGNHLLKLINEVLDLSKIESGEFDVEVEQVALDNIVDECIALISSIADAKNITITNNISCDKTHIIRADHTRISQVILNLLSNAVKYNRNFGTVTLEIEHKASNILRLWIIDNGEGLDVLQQQKLFSPFERMGAEFTDTEGTGIGLMISKRLIELMGGNIGVESSPGEGCRFWIEMLLYESVDKVSTDHTKTSIAANLVTDPATRPATSSIGHVASDVVINNKHNKADSKSILYIEDNSANMLLVSQIIEGFTPYTLIPAETPMLGLSLAKNEKPDLILLDITLPEIDGFEVLRRLRQDTDTAAIPVVAISANAMTRDIELGMASGFQDYLSKPIDMKVLLEVVQRELAGSSISHLVS